MKTKYWILGIVALLVLCLALSFVLMQPGQNASHVQVWSEGKLLHTLPLSVDTRIQVTTDRGTNVITVQNGKVAVTEATCPDHHCIDRGFCSGGTQIVCLPNRLVLEFKGTQTVDAVAG